MLFVENISTGYDKKQILSGLSLEVEKGDFAGIIGPNGSGKSTLLKAIFGLLPLWKGKVHLQGEEISAMKPVQLLARGIVYVPQGNQVFASMTVKENLLLGGVGLSRAERRERIDEVREFFPVLNDRLKAKASQLSGGERQMLALGRALVSKPTILMLDEPSLGLSPRLVVQVFEKIIEMQERMDLTVIMVEQKVNELLEICEKVFSLKLGDVAFAGLAEELRGNKERLKELFL